MTRHPERRGISLLEVLVALVLVSTVGMSMMAWMQQSLDGSRRLREHVAAVSAEREATAWMLQQDFRAKPEGVERLGALWVRWRSEPAEPVVRNRTFGEGDGLGPWMLGLHRVDVEIRERRDGPLLRSFQLLVHQRHRT